MQRNFAYQNALLALGAFALFALYTALGSIYLLLPPLFGVLFFLFCRSLERQKFEQVLLILLMLLLYEVDKGYLLFSALVYFALVYYLVIPKVRQYIDCRWCINLILIILAYLGYWLFSMLLHQVLWMPLPTLDWHIFYYIAIEFFLVSLL